MLRPAIALLLLTLLPSAVEAQIICSEPLAPICTDASFSADGQFERQQCTSDVERYRRELDDYVSCLEAKLAAAGEESARMEAVEACLLDETCDLSTLGR